MAIDSVKCLVSLVLLYVRLSSSMTERALSPDKCLLETHLTYVASLLVCQYSSYESVILFSSSESTFRGREKFDNLFYLQILGTV